MENKKWKDLINGIRSGEKLPKKNQLLVIFLIGLLLFVIVFPVPDSSSITGGTVSESAGEESGTGSGTASGTGGNSGDADAYVRELEKRTEKALTRVEGVGEVTVMITLKSGEESVIEKDLSSSSQTTEEEDSAGGTRNTEDGTSESTSVYEQSADGASVPYVSKKLSPEIEGVVVIAQGGGNAVVAADITEAVQALFGVEAHKIKIMKRADT